jgi:hypothetical protein
MHPINEKDSSYSLIKNNVTIPYYYLNFSGDLYESNITIGTQTNAMKLVAFDTITLIDKYSGKGRFSLSFLNYGFNTEKKMFGLSIGYENSFVHLGGYDPDKIKDITRLRTFNVTKTNYSDELQNIWYVSFNTLYINDYKLQNKNLSLTFDISTSTFHVPKDFFFENLNHIFHEDSKCQVQPEGYFLCTCDKDYQKKFGNFKFINENNDFIYVNITDYLYFDDSSTNYCYVLLELNYENDLFIAGKFVLNNYYSIFDIDNNQLKMYYNYNGNYTFDQQDIIIFLFVLCMGGLLLLCCFFIYKRFFSRDTDEELNINEDLIEENGEGEERREDENQNEGNNQNQNENNDNNQEINLQNIDNNDNIRDNDENIIILNENHEFANIDNENNIVNDNNNNNIDNNN